MPTIDEILQARQERVDASHVPPLIGALKDEDKNLRRAANAALQAIRAS